MAFTPVTITGKFVNADGTACTGTFCATLSAPMVNGTVEQAVSPVCGILDAAGNMIAQSGLAFILNSTQDVGTLPAGEFYKWSIKIAGQSLVTFNAPLPTTSPTTIVVLQEAAL